MGVQLADADVKVSQELQEEINSIKSDAGIKSDQAVEYKPQAWTREGHTD